MHGATINFVVMYICALVGWNRNNTKMQGTSIEIKEMYISIFKFLFKKKFRSSYFNKFLVNSYFFVR